MNYALNLIPTYGVETIVNVSQYDTELRTVDFTLYSGNNLYEIPENATVTIRGTKPDNTGFEYPCSFNGSNVTVEFKDQMTVVAGIVPCEIRITSNGDIIGTANFALDVEKSALQSDIVISETELPLIEEAAQNAQKAEEAAQRAERALSNISVTVNQTEDGAQIIARDLTQETEAYVYNGQPGEDGFSPDVTVEQTSDGIRITVTDKDGTTTAFLPGSGYDDSEIRSMITNEVTNRTNADNLLQTAINTNTANISTETNNREAADHNLQEQIDALTSHSDVVDIVGTYAELQNYDTSSLGNNDIIKVLSDSTHENASSYYRWNKNTQAWSYVGSEGAYYTKSESDNKFVPQTRTINGKSLNENVNLTAADVDALPGTTVVPTKVSDLNNDLSYQTEQQVATTVETEVGEAVSELNTTIRTYQKKLTAGSNITISNENVISATVPTKVSDLTNDSGFATESYVQAYVNSLNANNTQY